MTVDVTEHGSLDDPRAFEPSLNRRDRTMTASGIRDADFSPVTELIRFRLAQMEDYALADMFDVGVIEPHQLRAPERPREADE